MELNAFPHNSDRDWDWRWSRGSASTCSSACLAVYCCLFKTGCGPKRDWLLGKSLFQPPLRDLNTGGEPNPLMSLHVFNLFLKDAGPAGPARYVGMELKRGESRRYRRFPIELVEKTFPQSQSVIRMVAGAVLVAGAPAVAKRLAGKLDQPRLPVLPDERKIVGEGIAVPDIAFLHEDLYG